MTEKIIPLGDICRIFTGKKDVNQTTKTGKYSFYSCSPNKLLSDEYLYDGEAIIIAGNGSYTGRVRYANEKFDLYQRTYACVLKDEEENTSTKYLYYYLKAKFEPRFIGGTRGSSIPYIVKGDISDFQIHLPSLEKQYEISSVLSNIDNKITNNIAINDNLSNELFCSIREFRQRLKVKGLSNHKNSPDSNSVLIYLIQFSIFILLPRRHILPHTYNSTSPAALSLASSLYLRTISATDHGFNSRSTIR